MSPHPADPRTALARRPFLELWTASLALALAACQPPADEPAEMAAAAPASPELALADLRRTVTIAQDKFVSLAEAMPEPDYAWRPMVGVRSVAEVYTHISADNYFVPALMGVEAPPETGVTDDPATFQAFQARQMSKADVVAHVRASFEHLLAAMDATGGELDREITLGQSTTTVGDVWIRAVTHLHEHLGQSIAYARSNEVVPPWSR